MSTMQWDMRLQWRNGFYYASLVIVIAFLLIFSQVSVVNLDWLLPVMLVNNMVVGTFYFIGGLVLLEKDEGSLAARIVTPLRPAEYLTAKTATVSGLALLESGLLVLIAVGWRVHWLPLLLGVLATAVLLCLAGFMVVVRYDSINNYLLPSILYVLLLCLPVMAYLAGWQHWLLYLHPLQATLTLIGGGWQPLMGWQWVYGVVVTAVWIAIAAQLSLRTFHRFVIRYA
jgi:fluoroquinolone transport system permease protein